MAYLYKGQVCESASPAGAMDEIRAAEIFKLGRRGDKRSRDLFSRYEAANPDGAAVAKSFAAATWHEREQANRRADAIVKAAKAYCLSCHKRLKPRNHHCPQCGKVNPNFIAKKGGRVSKQRRKAAKSKRAYAKKVQKAAWSAAAGRPVSSYGEAMNAMMRAELNHWDPERRLVAEKALGGRGILAK